MDRSGDELLGWSIDGVAAGLLAMAAGACLLMLKLPVQAVTAAAATGVMALAGLRHIRPEPRRFRFRPFALETGKLEEAEIDVLELTEALGPEPLELIDPLHEPEADSRVVQLFALRPLPTPGELARRIDHHLGGNAGEERGGRIFDLEVDASAALRQALGELRRGLG